MTRDQAILSAYREAVFAANEKGLRGPAGKVAAVKAAAKVASKLTGQAVSEGDVLALVEN